MQNNNQIGTSKKRSYKQFKDDNKELLQGLKLEVSKNNSSCASNNLPNELKRFKIS